MCCCCNSRHAAVHILLYAFWQHHGNRINTNQSAMEMAWIAGEQASLTAMQQLQLECNSLLLPSRRGCLPMASLKTVGWTTSTLLQWTYLVQCPWTRMHSKGQRTSRSVHQYSIKARQPACKSRRDMHRAMIHDVAASLDTVEQN